jgi:hypothetical protein
MHPLVQKYQHAAGIVPKAVIQANGTNKTLFINILSITGALAPSLARSV